MLCGIGLTKIGKGAPVKRMSPQQLARLDANRRNRWKTELRRRNKFYVAATATESKHTQGVARIVAIPRNRKRIGIQLPAVLSIRDNYAPTLAAIEALRTATLVQGCPVMLDFNKVISIEPAATLMLAAEIDRCQRLRPYRGKLLVNGNYPPNMDVLLQLQEMGFHKAIGVPDLELPDVPETVDRPRFLKLFSLNVVESELAASITDVVSVGAFAMSNQLKGRMTGALKEAMGNAVEHAYRKAPYYPALPGRWWCAAYVDPAKCEMMIILFDQGIGIPGTLNADVFDLIRSLVTTRSWGLSDGYMIAAATELYRTSTGQSGRGRGFRDMKRFIDSCDDGELRVLSNRGSYRYMTGGEAIADEETSIGGTLVEWRVRHGQPMDFDDA